MNNLVSVSHVQSGVPEMPNLVRGSANEVNNSINNDFISHPQQYPFEIKRVRQWSFKRWPWAKHSGSPESTTNPKQSSQPSVGLRLQSQHYFKSGTVVEISIPLRGEAQYFTGTVVLVRELAEGFEIGLWLSNVEDEARARIVEKICHAECNLVKKTPSIKEPATHTNRGTELVQDGTWLDLSGKTALGH